MKTVHDLTQGSEAWELFRLDHHGASEAAAMLGLSPHVKRTELLHAKHTGLPREFSRFVQERILDHGHEVEALARPHIEANIIGEPLYPVTFSDGKLSASCDGITLDDETAAEHKQWNAELAASVEVGVVPDHHMPQCQQVLMVTGARRLAFVVSDGAPERMVHAWVVPDMAWFQRLRDGWAQFDRDLAAYVPTAAAEPEPVGKAPETLPALLINVTGAVTASNLPEFKATALAAIRSVNRELKTDQDFADADKAVKWCAEVESRLKAAKEHALSQTATIDALFKALDDIAAESKTVRLDLGKLIDRRKVERKEDAVAAARRELDAHIAGLNGELAPMALRPAPVDFGAAIKGLRSFASMDDALRTAVANGKIAADAQAKGIRANLVHFKKTTEGMEFLFSDVGQLVHKAADDFESVLASRIGKHLDMVKEQERKRQADDAARIAAAEQRVREDADIRILTEAANDCTARGHEYIADAIVRLDAMQVIDAPRVSDAVVVARGRMVSALRLAEQQRAQAEAAAKVIPSGPGVGESPAPQSASPRVVAMGVGQAADAAPAGVQHQTSHDRYDNDSIGELLAHLHAGIDGDRFPSHPKPHKGWWDDLKALMSAAETL